MGCKRTEKKVKTSSKCTLDLGSLGVESAKSMKKAKASWLLPNRIVRDALCVVEGQKCVGKSTFLTEMAVAVTTGKPFLGKRKTKPGNVLWFPGEEDAIVSVRPRLEACGADLSRVFFPSKNEKGRRRRMKLPTDIDFFDRLIQELDVCLAIIDPLSSYVDTKCSLKDDQQIHEVLDPVADVCHSSHVTTIVTRHLKKGRGGNKLDNGLGGVAFAGVARSVLLIEHPEEKQPERYLRLVACNLTSPQPAIQYEISGKNGYGFMDNIKFLSFEEDREQEETPDRGERDAKADAITLLTEALAEGPQPFKYLLEEARSAGISERTLRTAKVEIGLETKRNGAAEPPRWEWGWPGTF